LLILPPTKDMPAKPQVEEVTQRKKSPKAAASAPQAAASGTGGKP
jgi:uncharacterized phage infection (PIP) family protein YhgE